jgi:predicted dehydrogenase
MSERPIGIGVIGFGRRLQQVTRLLTEAAGPAIVVRHACSASDAGRAAANLLPDGPRVAMDYTAMLDDPDVSWVLIGSTNDHHREHAVAALAAGKHVFCEKPVGISIDDCAAVAAAHAATDRQFVVGFVLRYAPLYRQIKRLVAEGGIGRLVSLEFNETLDFNHGGFIMSDWRRQTRLSGGHLLEKCSHDLDIVNWIVDAPAARVASFGGLAFFTPENAGRAAAIGDDAQGRPAYATWGVGRDGVGPFSADKDIVDHQVAILEYANGVRASFHTNLNSGLPERRLYLLGTEGAIRADLNHGVIEHRRIGHDTPTTTFDQRSTAGLHGGGDVPMVAELLATMTTGAATATPLSTGIAAAVTCLAAERARTGGTVVDLGPIWDRVGRTGPAVGV